MQKIFILTLVFFFAIFPSWIFYRYFKIEKVNNLQVIYGQALNNTDKIISDIFPLIHSNTSHTNSFISFVYLDEDEFKTKWIKENKTSFSYIDGDLPLANNLHSPYIDLDFFYSNSQDLKIYGFSKKEISASNSKTNLKMTHSSSLNLWNRSKTSYPGQAFTIQGKDLIFPWPEDYFIYLYRFDGQELVRLPGQKKGIHYSPLAGEHSWLIYSSVIQKKGQFLFSLVLNNGKQSVHKPLSLMDALDIPILKYQFSPDLKYLLHTSIDKKNLYAYHLPYFPFSIKGNNEILNSKAGFVLNFPEIHTIRSFTFHPQNKREIYLLAKMEGDNTDKIYRYRLLESKISSGQIQLWEWILALIFCLFIIFLFYHFRKLNRLVLIKDNGYFQKKLIIFELVHSLNEFSR